MKKVLAVLVLATAVSMMIPALARRPVPEPETFTISNMAGDITMDTDSLAFTTVAYGNWESYTSDWHVTLYESNYLEGTIPVAFTINGGTGGDSLFVQGYFHTLYRIAFCRRVGKETYRYIKWYIVIRDMYGNEYRIVPQPVPDTSNWYDPDTDTWHAVIKDTSFVKNDETICEGISVTFDLKRG